ncbi:MAG: nucleotidyltransferase [Verrucomicrobiae bacterium]|nr:nucleotidyltransferase [Verrucomicrobiae bacterium]
METPTSAPSGSDKVPRAPRLKDLSRLCAELNRLGARYVVVGGFAIIQAGYARFTDDLDLLVDASLENERRVFEALRCLPDKAVDQLEPGDVDKYIVVRVGDEILVDLIKSGCGVDYAEAIKDAEFSEIDGVRIPFASPQTLWRMKQTKREKDVPDRLFLRMLLESQGIKVEPAPPVHEPAGALMRWIKKLFGR